MKNVKKNHKFTKFLGTVMATVMILTMTVPIGVSAKESAPATDNKIIIDDETVVNETNCSAHKEWKP